MSEWHQLEDAELLASLHADATVGLAADEAAQRWMEHGPNELVERAQRRAWGILWEQIREPMVVLLLVAAGVSGFVHEFTDVVVILTIVVLNTLLGFVQDYRAEKAMAALKRLAAPEVTVRRDGSLTRIPARRLVPGDLVLLEAGNRVPADCRLLECHQLHLQEAALTGDSQSVGKQVGPLVERNLAIGDRKNMVYMGTEAASGRGRAIVVETGMRTELGKIADLMQSVAGKRTPLQRQLAHVGAWVAVVVIVIVGLVFFLGLLRGEEITLLLMTALSLAVAAVPEGLPAVATIVLALGAKRMLRRRALIRKLPAVESLGSVSVICSDKTGTLTENRMRVSAFEASGVSINVPECLGRFEQAGEGGDASLSIVDDLEPLPVLLLIGGLCNDAELKADSSGQGGQNVSGAIPSFETIGDPTEGALIEASARFGIAKADLEGILPRVAEAPFDPQRKRMTTIHELHDPGTPSSSIMARALDSVGPPRDGRFLALMKGAVDSVLDASTHIWSHAREHDAESGSLGCQRQTGRPGEPRPRTGVSLVGSAAGGGVDRLDGTGFRVSGVGCPEGPTTSRSEGRRGSLQISRDSARDDHGRPPADRTAYCRGGWNPHRRTNADRA